MMRSETGTDAIVIGAGALGCAIAWRLAQEKLSVILVERGEPGGEASQAAAGILGAQMESHGPGPMLTLQLASRALYPALAEELREATGIDVRCRIEGVLQQAFSDDELQTLRTRMEWQRAAGLRTEWLERGAGVSPGALAGLLLPEDGQVDNRLLSRALRLAAERAGVSIVRADARAVVEQGGRVAGVNVADAGVNVADASGERLLSASSVVVAAGSWSALLPGARIAAGAVRPVRGQMLALSARPSSGRVLTGAGGYAVPRQDRVLIGATVEEAGFEKQVTAAGLRTLLAIAARLVPELDGAEVLESWSGLRPASRDGLPLLGAPVSGPAGTFVCTGHYRSGILLTPLSAALLRDAVLGRPARFDLAPFRPDRF